MTIFEIHIAIKHCSVRSKTVLTPNNDNLIYSIHRIELDTFT
jgi:hypothetical protein